ncbi:hypothetical protein MRX96_056413 [Rhipicephalus microplus]
MAMEQLALSSSGIQSTSSEALQVGLSEPGEEASGGAIEPASPSSTVTTHQQEALCTASTADVPRSTLSLSLGFL